MRETLFDDMFEPAQRAKPEGPFLRQVAGERNIYSCVPTSILNGWIYRGELTLPEAKQVQARMVQESDRWFGDLKLENGRVIRTFSGPVSGVPNLVRTVVGRQLQLEGMDVHRLVSVVAHIRNMVNYGYPIVGGDSSHAVLASQYFAGEDILRIVDPLNPAEDRLMEAVDFSRQIEKSAKEHGLGIVVVK